MSPTRQSILDAALASFNLLGYEATTVAEICESAGVSNGSFFHHFGSKQGLAGSLFLAALSSYHAALIEELPGSPTATQGLACLIASHVRWVVAHRAEARFMFEQIRAEWLVPIQAEQQTENTDFAEAVEAWRKPLIEKGELENVPPLAFFSQVIGPSQLLCRAWLSSKTMADPTPNIEFFTHCAIRALVKQPKTSTKRTPS